MPISVCKRCGAVLDIPEEFFRRDELEKLSARFHIRLESARVVFEGVCPQCERKSSDVKDASFANLRPVDPGFSRKNQG